MFNLIVEMAIKPSLNAKLLPPHARPSGGTPHGSPPQSSDTPPGGASNPSGAAGNS